MEPLFRDPRTRKLTFTGSTEVGRTLIDQAADQVLRISMELGGNAPFVVFDDADLDAAVEGAMVAKMRNIGEACTAANRFHVHERGGRGVRRDARRRMGALKVGRGTEPGVQVGPLIDDAARDKVTELVDDARGRARGCWSEAARDGAGYFYEPTVLADVPDDARLRARRSSGRCAAIGIFDREEAIAAANDTPFGLVSYVYTRDLRAGRAGLRGARDRHDRPQPGHGLQPRRPVRRRQAVGLRPRGRARRHRRVPRDEVRGDQRPVVGEGWSREDFTRFGTHSSTHVDAPYHYNSTVGGRRAQTIDELPLELFLGPASSSTSPGMRTGTP